MSFDVRINPSVSPADRLELTKYQLGVPSRLCRRMVVYSWMHIIVPLTCMSALDTSRLDILLSTTFEDLAGEVIFFRDRILFVQHDCQ